MEASLTSKNAVPEGLGPHGCAFWAEVTSTARLAPHKARLLFEACREIDLIAELEAARGELGLIVEGSTGQPRIHPAVPELRLHRATLKVLVAELGLSDEAVDAPKSSRRSESARAAARARWGSAGVSA